MPDLNAIASQLADFERITREYVEEDPVQNANTSIETATDQFNAWIEETTPGLEREKAALADLLKTINELSDEIDDVGRRLKVSPQDGSCPGTGECDEAALTRYNGLVQRYNALVKDYKQKEGGYSVRVREFNGEAERRRAQVQSVKATVTSDFEAYQRWVREEGLERLWKELIAVHVTLMQRARLRRPSDELQGFIQRVRHLRRVLGAHAMQQRDTVEGVPHVVRATLCQSVECHLLVDCGASVIAITPELVDVLGLHDRLGEKVKIILPNAIRIEAPQLVIPKIRIGEAEADYVKAVVLKEPLPGVDGCLGLSFLDRFNYRIENRSLSLEPLEPAESEPCFDVFISHRADVLPAARAIFDHLVASGYKPFLSEVSVPAFHTTEFQKAIDAALQSAEHFIIVGSARSHFEAPWVEAEWRLFESCKRTGKKRGNIIPVLSGAIKADDLPFALRLYEVVSMDDPDWKRILINYLPRY